MISTSDGVVIGGSCKTLFQSLKYALNYSQSNKSNIRLPIKMFCKKLILFIFTLVLLGNSKMILMEWAYQYYGVGIS